MNIIGKTYLHPEKKFRIKVTTCNRRIATTQDLETGEIVKFNRGKFEYMINRGVFSIVEE